MQQDELSAAIERIRALEAENAALVESNRKQANARLMCKVSTKGGVSVYGLQRFPVTFYAEQWARLADFMPTIVAFCQDNAASLTIKGTARIEPDAEPAQTGAE